MFTTLKLTLDGDGAAKDLRGRKDWQGGFIEEMIMIDKGTTGDNASVAFRIQCVDGSVVIAQTTWRLLHNCVKAAEARYGEPEEQAC